MQDNIESTQGCCPICGSENLNYGQVQSCEIGVFYPWVCGDCGADGKECYTLSFDSHQEITVKKE